MVVGGSLMFGSYFSKPSTPPKDSPRNLFKQLKQKLNAGLFTAMQRDFSSAHLNKFYRKGGKNIHKLGFTPPRFLPGIDMSQSMTTQLRGFFSETNNTYSS